MKPLSVGFIGAGGFARHTLYPALHFGHYETLFRQMLNMFDIDFAARAFPPDLRHRVMSQTARELYRLPETNCSDKPPIL